MKPSHTHTHSYCNHRILKFNSAGAFLQEWSQPVDGLFLFVPHSLALSKSQDHLLVADRENGRIISYETSSGKSRVFSHLPGKVFAISLNGSGNWPLFAINNSLKAAAHGYTVNQEGEVANVWGPEGVSFRKIFSFRPLSLVLHPGGGY